MGQPPSRGGPWWNRPGARQRAVSALIALAVLLVVFPAVILRQGSLTPDNLYRVVDDREVVVTDVYPSREGRLDYGFADHGGPTWQVEPAMYFMRRSLTDGFSPMWNPWSGSGSVGPETLVDGKMSPLVLTAVVLGGDSTGYTAAVLLILFLGLYAVQQLFLRTFASGRVAATGAAVVYLLNGFAVAYLVNGVGAPYFLFPLLLHALLEWRRYGGPARFSGAALAVAALLATTLAPVVLLVVLAVTVVVVAVRLDHSTDDVSRWRLVLRELGPVLGAGVVGLLLAAVVAVPAVRNLGLSADASLYADRRLGSKPVAELLTVLTPRHLWDTSDPASWFGEIRASGFTTTLGIITLVLVAATVRGRRHRAVGIATLALLAVGVGCHLGLPGFLQFGNLPVLRMIRADYWAVLAAVALVVLVGVGVDRLRHGQVHLLDAGVGVVAMITTAVVVAMSVDAPAPTSLIWVVRGALFLALGLVVMAGVRHRPSLARPGAAIVVVLMAAELLTYMNHSRPVRFDRTLDPPPYVEFLQSNVGHGRIFNVGRGGIYPEWGTALRLRQIGTLQTGQRPDYRAFYLANINPDPSLFLTAGADDGPLDVNSSALDLLGVSHVVVDLRRPELLAELEQDMARVLQDDLAGVVVLENSDHWDRARLVPAIEIGQDVASQRRDWQAGRAIVEQDSPLIATARAAGVRVDTTDAVVDGVPVGEVSFRVDEPSEVVLDVASSVPSVLVLADSWHPDWVVEVDGRTAVLARADGAFRGVVVPEGDHEVRFRYRPWPVYLGVVLSSSTALVLAAASLRGWWLARRRVPLA